MRYPLVPSPAHAAPVGGWRANTVALPAEESGDPAPGFEPFTTDNVPAAAALAWSPDPAATPTNSNAADNAAPARAKPRRWERRVVNIGNLLMIELNGSFDAALTVHRPSRP